MASSYRCVQQRKPSGLFYSPTKRIFDIAGSLVGLFVLSPVFVVLGLAVAVSSPGPVFFVADRVGLQGKHFWMIKFRSMYEGSHQNYSDLRSQDVDSRNGPFYKNGADPRITPVGKFLRQWSLDEIPQLVNVLLGHMSLVGPRPAFREEVDEMGSLAGRRHFVRPGMTGICQVNGRSSIPFSDQVELEEYYLHHRGWSLDLCILRETVGAVLSKAGAH